MKFLLIQLVFNVIVFKIATVKFIANYRIVAFFIYPILITALIVYPKDGIQLNDNGGFALDITALMSKTYIGVLFLIFLIQTVFNVWVGNWIRTGKVPIIGK